VKSSSSENGDIRFDDFRDLEVWESCRELRGKIWVLSKKLPAEEKHRLCDQMIRASRSATANIAEGYGRFHYQESIQFCRQARGSLYELIDHVTAAVECGYIGQKEGEELVEEIKKAIILLNGYIRYLKSRKQNS
jgi:four helix bundle protein